MHGHMDVKFTSYSTVITYEFYDNEMWLAWNSSVLKYSFLRTFNFHVPQGHDTTSTAISWTLFLLGLHPDVQVSDNDLMSLFWQYVSSQIISLTLCTGDCISGAGEHLPGFWPPCDHAGPQRDEVPWEGHQGDLKTVSQCPSYREGTDARRQYR